MEQVYRFSPNGTCFQPVFTIKENASFKRSAMNLGWLFYTNCYIVSIAAVISCWRQRGSVVRAGDLNTKDPGSNPRLGLLNEFGPGDVRGNSPRFVNSQLVCLLPVGILNWERGEGNFNMILKSPLRGVIIKYLLFIIISVGLRISSIV